MSASEQTSASKRYIVDGDIDEEGKYFWVTDRILNARIYRSESFTYEEAIEIADMLNSRPSPQQPPDTMNDTVLKRQSEMMGEIAKVGWNNNPFVTREEGAQLRSAGQPDELSNAREKIKQLESKIEYLEGKIKDKEEWTDNWG